MLTKSRLKQIIQEELKFLIEEGTMGHDEKSRQGLFNQEYNQLKAEIQKEWEVSDQQTSGPYQSFEMIAASVVQFSNMDDQDLSSLVLEAMSEYNQTHEDKIDIDMKEFFETLYTMAKAENDSRREDEATNPW